MFSSLTRCNRADRMRKQDESTSRVRAGLLLSCRENALAGKKWGSENSSGISPLLRVESLDRV